MPFCANCGSYVSPGTNICSCGTTFGYRSEPEEDEQTEFEKQQEERRRIRNKKATISSKSDFDDQEELLTLIGKKNLITLTGTYFYDNPKFEKGMKFKLVKEEDNEFDSNAIAVYLDDVKVGYVANNTRTSCYLTSMARDVQISDIVYAEYILYFAYRYHIAEIQYHI